MVIGNIFRGRISRCYAGPGEKFVLHLVVQNRSPTMERARKGTPAVLSTIESIFTLPSEDSDIAR